MQCNNSKTINDKEGLAKRLMKHELHSFKAYNANQLPHRIKLDANESPFSLPQGITQKLAKSLDELNIYPDTDIIELRQRLAAYWQTKGVSINENMLIVGNGSDQIIELLIQAFVGKGETVICPTPSFDMYALTTTICGGKPLEIGIYDESADKSSADNVFCYNIDEFIQKANDNKAKLVFLCTPNNPTGGVMPEQDIIRVIKGCSESIIVLDEAYAEFSGQSLMDRLNEFNNLIILRTFSKAYGLAGIRCGYGAASPEIIEVLNLVRPPYNLNTISQAIAFQIIDNEEEIKSNINFIVNERNRLSSLLSSIDNIRVYPSDANFILVRFIDKNSSPDALRCEKVYKWLVDEGILVRRYGGARPLMATLRISIGNDWQNDEFFRVFKMANDMI